jgi:hypothetical protein
MHQLGENVIYFECLIFRFTRICCLDFVGVNYSIALFDFLIQFDLLRYVIQMQFATPGGHWH